MKTTDLENWLVHWKEGFGLWYHLVNGISYGRPQNDPIKRSVSVSVSVSAGILVSVCILVSVSLHLSVLAEISVQNRTENQNLLRYHNHKLSAKI